MDNIEQKTGFDRIRQMVAEQCTNTLAVRMVDEMRFMSDFDPLYHELQLVEEMRQIVLMDSGFPQQDFIDLTTVLNHLHVGNTVIPKESLFDLKLSLRTIRECYLFLTSKAEKYPQLANLAIEVELGYGGKSSQLNVVNSLLGKLIDDHGELYDNASPVLSEIRRTRARKAAEVDAQISSALARAKREGWAPEGAEVTLRHGRPVIPLLTTHRRRMRGIIQDESASRQTAFIEPTEVVELGNDLRLCKIEGCFGYETGASYPVQDYIFYWNTATNQIYIPLHEMGYVPSSYGVPVYYGDESAFYNKYWSETSGGFDEGTADWFAFCDAFRAKYPEDYYPYYDGNGDVSMEGTVAGGGYIWHTTGSGKTLTSFKTARQASQLPYIDKVLFVVDRKDLDYQTMKEYDRFEKGAANSNTSTVILKRQLEDPNAHIIITTIQKLSTFIKKNPGHEVYQKHVVIIFDECHRSQFGDMHTAIVKSFKKYHLFGFTGTPIFATNTGAVRNPQFFTTEQTFGDQLHTYTIVDAINDKNVLPFRVDYIKTMDTDPDIDDKDVWDIDREKAFMAPERVRLVTKYILDHFDQKTYRGDKTYMFSVLTNIGDVASADRGAVEEIKQKQRVSGFNSIFCVSSVQMAKLYYQEFKKQMAADPTKALRIATIYSYGANEEESDGILDEENSEDTSALDQSSRDFLDAAIKDYNEMFHTNYSTDGDKFQNYYKDVSLRMKNKELDILIVVNMFLTGFDATTLNTLWVDKNLKMHGLIQAFSRTNRILNSIKTFGNIVCFRNLQKRVDDAIALFGDKNASGIVLMQTFKDYYYGYIGPDDKHHPGYVDLMEDLETRFPLSQPQIIGEQNQKDFIALFGAILRMRNLLSSFDDFAGKELISERDLQDYLGRYQDLRDEWRPKHGDKEDISDDVIFEVELIKQIEINIDYILLLVKKYHDSHCQDKEVLITIRKAVDASPELRSKKALIETFIAGINDVDDVLIEWRYYVSEEREKQLMQIIKEENLNETETRRFLEDSFRNGEVKTTGTDIDKLMPPVSRFGGGNRAQKKQTIIEKLKAFFEKYFGVGRSFKSEEE